MRNLSSYVPGGRVSSGLLAWFRGQLVFAVSQEKYWIKRPGETRIALVGIGGGQEAGETLLETVAREAQEEANAAIAVAGAAFTLWIDADERVERRSLPDEPPGESAPLLIWQRRIRLRRDDGTPYERDYINPVYEADFLQQPSPGAEVPGLLFSDVADFLALLAGPRSLSDLLRGSMGYLGRSLPADAVIELQGSAYYLAKYWSRLGRR